MPSTFSVNDFISQVKTGGLARVNRYEVIIRGPGNNAGDSPLVSLFCELANFAEMKIALKPYRIFGPSYPKPVYPEYGGIGFPMTFLLDRDMQVKRYFDDWMHKVTVPGFFHLNYPANYSSDIFIRQLTEGYDGLGEGTDQVPVSYEMRLVGAFPHSMSAMDLDHNNHNTFARLQVLFAFRYWETTNTIDVAGTNIIHFDPMPDYEGGNPLVRPPVQVPLSYDNPGADNRVNTIN